MIRNGSGATNDVSGEVPTRSALRISPTIHHLEKAKQ